MGHATYSTRLQATAQDSRYVEVEDFLYYRPGSEPVQQTLGATSERRRNSNGANQKKCGFCVIQCLVAAIRLLLRSQTHSDRFDVQLANCARLADHFHVFERPGLEGLPLLVPALSHLIHGVGLREST